MTEQEWLACTRPEPMLAHLGSVGVAGDHRKCWLIACAFLERTARLIDEPLCRAAADLCRRRADGLASREEMEATYQAVSEGHEKARELGELFGSWKRPLVLFAALHALDGRGPLLDPVSTFAARAWGCAVAEGPHCPLDEYEWEGDEAEDEPLDEDRWEEEWEARLETRARRHQALLVRDIAGNPFRSLSVKPGWLTPDVVGLAGTIYGERAFDRLPILADALVDAGCDSAEVIEHCRAERRPHACGCWVIDLLRAEAGGPRPAR